MNSQDADKNWLIVGLGNPGAEYENTRHNLGFMVIDLLAENTGTSVRREECRALIGQTSVEDKKIELIKPLTYMNLSGESLSCLLKKENRSIENTIVIVDDLALPFGSIRLRKKGSDGGHNGLKSISNCLRTKDFARLRIGIQPDHPLSNTKKFVLEKFPKKDFEKLAEVLERSAEAVRSLIRDGIDKTMSQYNG